VTKRWNQALGIMQATNDRVDQIERHLDKMETILMVREPTSTVAADAYDGLRKQVAGSMSERVAHLSQLAQMATAVAAGADAETLARVVDGWIESASLVRVYDVNDESLSRIFESVEDLGGDIEVLEPAYVDGLTGRVIRLGRVRRGAPRSQSPADSTAAIDDDVSSAERADGARTGSPAVTEKGNLA
jgi:hypothetical protein